MNHKKFSLPFAEDVNYWKTGSKLPDTIIGWAIKQIRDVGGEVIAEHFGVDHQNGNSAFVLEFKADGEEFRIVWPVLPTRTGEEEAAAKRQAASFLFHDVKAKCMKAKIFGVRGAFLPFLKIGRNLVAAQVTTPELSKALPKLLGGPST